MEHLKRIYEALLNRKEKVCSKSEIMSIIKEYKETFKAPIDMANAIKYLSRHHHIKRIFKSFYYVNSVDEKKRGFCFYGDKELLFIALNKLGIKWYVGLGSASYISGKNWQVPRLLHIINSKFSGSSRVLHLNVRFFKIKESLFFGLKKVKTKNNVKYSYSTQAKTLLDEVYLGISDTLIRGKEANKYLRRYPKWVGKK